MKGVSEFIIKKILNWVKMSCKLLFFFVNSMLNAQNIEKWTSIHIIGSRVKDISY